MERVCSSKFKWLGHCGRADAHTVIKDFRSYTGFIIVSKRTGDPITFLLERTENELGIYYSVDRYNKKGKYVITLVF